MTASNALGAGEGLLLFVELYAGALFLGALLVVAAYGIMRFAGGRLRAYNKTTSF